MKVKLFLSAFFIFLMIPSAQAELSDMDDLMAGFAEKLQLVGVQLVGDSYADSSSFILYSSTASSVSVGTNLYRYISAVEASDSLSSPLGNEPSFRSILIYKWSENGYPMAFSSYVDAENNLIASNAPLVVDKVGAYMNSNVKNTNQGGFFAGQYFSDGFTFSKKLSDVPDPGSFFLLGLGALALALVRRKSAKSSV